MEKLEKYITYKLPEAYISFLSFIKQNFIDGLINDYIYIYLDEDVLIERNETFEMKEYLPSYIGIGNDSGGCEIIISLTEENSKIYYTSHGAYFEDSLDIVAENFQDWIDKKFSLDIIRPKVKRVFSIEESERIKRNEQLSLLHIEMARLKKKKENQMIPLKDYILQKRKIEENIKQYTRD